MSPSNIPRSKSIKQRISDYLSKRIHGEAGISEDSHRHQGNSSELCFSNLSEVLREAARQPPSAKIGFRQRFITEYNIALAARQNTLKRSATTGPRKPRFRPEIHRSASTSNRPRNHQPSSSTRRSSITRGRRLRGEDSSNVSRPSAGSRQNHREHSPPPRSSSVARSSSPKPLPRAQSYRPTSFATTPTISNPLAFVHLNGGPAAHGNANIPQTLLTDGTDPLDRAEFDVHPTQRKQRRASEPQSTTEMPIHSRPGSKERVEGNYGPMARTTRARSIISTGTRWGDFMSEFQSGPASKPAASNQAARAAPPRQPPLFQGRSRSPAKFPSFSPAAHHPRGASPRTRTPVEADPISPTSSGRQRSLRPVICKLCKGLSDPTISYPDVEYPVCSRCAPRAFASSKPAQRSRASGEPDQLARPTSSAAPRPPTPPVKDFAGFNFDPATAYPTTPSSTGSQPKFDAFSTSPLDNDYYYQSSSHRPRPPSSEYSHATSYAPPPPPPPTNNPPSTNPFASTNPYASAMGNPFTTELPLPGPRLLRPAPSTVGSYVTMSPSNHTPPFIPIIPPLPVPAPSTVGMSPSIPPLPPNRRSSFYRFYDDVLAEPAPKGKGKGKEKERAWDER